MSYSVIAKDRTKMEIIGKKERKKSFRARRYWDFLDVKWISKND